VQNVSQSWKTRGDQKLPREGTSDIPKGTISKGTREKALKMDPYGRTMEMGGRED